jgi:hypothetical protein
MFILGPEKNRQCHQVECMLNQNNHQNQKQECMYHCSNKLRRRKKVQHHRLPYNQSYLYQWHNHHSYSSSPRDKYHYQKGMDSTQKIYINTSNDFWSECLPLSFLNNTGIKNLVQDQQYNQHHRILLMEIHNRSYQAHYREHHPNQAGSKSEKENSIQLMPYNLQ